MGNILEDNRKIVFKGYQPIAKDDVDYTNVKPPRGYSGAVVFRPRQIDTSAREPSVKSPTDDNET